MMNKTFVIASLAAATVIAAFVALAAPSTEVQASSAYEVKGDRLPIQKFGSACSQRAWPYYERECIRDSRQSTGQASNVRLVSTARL